MATEDIPAWKVWHPLSIWKALGILVVVQIVFQIGFVGLFSVLQISWSGASVGGLVGFAVAYFIVLMLAQKARASAASASDDASKLE